ncbi:MAG: hypothetical protein MZV63_13015, partial [Marinilabiliales bacterium]|nr:hypothetical protein [Marinilabiliales bacterium]
VCFVQIYVLLRLNRRLQTESTAPGSSDQTFGKAGMVTTETLTTELPGYSVYSRGLILQENGKAVMVAVASPGIIHGQADIMTRHIGHSL